MKEETLKNAIQLLGILDMRVYASLEYQTKIDKTIKELQEELKKIKSNKTE